MGWTTVLTSDVAIFAVAWSRSGQNTLANIASLIHVIK